MSRTRPRPYLVRVQAEAKSYGGSQAVPFHLCFAPQIGRDKSHRFLTIRVIVDDDVYAISRFFSVLSELGCVDVNANLPLLTDIASMRI